MAIIIVKFSPNAAARRRGLSFRAEELEDVQARMGKLLSDLALELKLRGKALTDGRGGVYLNRLKRERHDVASDSRFYGCLRRR